MIDGIPITDTIMMGIIYNLFQEGVATLVTPATRPLPYSGGSAFHHYAAPSISPPANNIVFFDFAGGNYDKNFPVTELIAA